MSTVAALYMLGEKCEELGTTPGFPPNPKDQGVRSPFLSQQEHVLWSGHWDFLPRQKHKTTDTSETGFIVICPQ